MKNYYLKIKYSITIKLRYAQLFSENFLNYILNSLTTITIVKLCTGVTKIVSVLCFLILQTPALAQFVYDASTLHNAASRSQTVQHIFYQRWDAMLDNYLHFDAYINLNWVYDFYVNTYNRGTGEKEAVPMRLVRTFSDVIFLFPIYSPHNEINPDESQTVDTTDITTFRKPWVYNTILLGFTLCGYHYGLTRSVEINRGSAGNESASDYAFSQFFDDIAAATLVFVPYITLHTGIIFNQQMEPNEDGTLDYNFNPSSISKRYFSSLSFFNTLTWRSTAANDRVESSEISISITQLLLLTGYSINYLPDTTIGYKRYKKYNDEPYDPVWVTTANGKSNTMSDSSRQQATLHTYYTMLSKAFSNFRFAAQIEFQHVDATLIDKRTEQKVKIPLMRLWWAKAGYDFLEMPGWDLILWLGVNKFYDPAISYHSKHLDNDTGGWFAMIDGVAPYITLSIKASYNEASELDKLVEAVDKYILEATASFRI